MVTSYKSQFNPVKKYADKEKIKCFDWPIPITEVENYDIGVVVSFGHLIPEAHILALPL